MVRSLRTLAIVLAIAPAGCFIDGGGSPDDDDAGSSGASAGDTTTSNDSSISAGPVTSETVNPTDGTSTSDDTGGESTDTSTSTSASTSSSSGADETGSTTGLDLLTTDILQPGDLVITEIMANPNCLGDNCEWFEVLNATELPIDLHGIGIGDEQAVQSGEADVFLNEHVMLNPGELGVFARSAPWPYPGAADPLIRFPGTLQLSNDAFESVGLFKPDDTLLDRTATFLPLSQPGRSRKLVPEAWNDVDNNDEEQWCWSNTLLPLMSDENDWGTPGYDADDCLLE